jgi:chemotaxis protein CheD
MTLSRAPIGVDEPDVRQQRVHIIQGQYFVSDDPNVVLVTLLGSCVAACIRDPIARVGGMNHFLLPGVDKGAQVREAERYGVHLMELLVNGLLQRGARKDRLEAKLFGGARTVENLSDIGRQNTIFAERFLKTEDITYAGGSCGGDNGRRIQFWPVSGRARQAFIAGQEVPIVVPPPAPHVDGDVEFF